MVNVPLIAFGFQAAFEALAFRGALALQVFEVDEEFGGFRGYFWASSSTFSSRTINFLARRTSSS
jgi:hypothetical protein